MSDRPNHQLPTGDPSAQSPDPANVDSLRARVRELENLCAELYEAGVEIGLAQPLLNKLWTVAAYGNAPHAFDVTLPQPLSDEGPLPDVPLVHNPSLKRMASAVAKPLEPLPVKRTVAVVDDDPALLHIVLKILSYENYDLIAAPSGRVALEKFDVAHTPVDLLITDYVMPGMNGRELAAQARKRYPDLKVLYETGFTDLLFDKRPELERNAAFIEKPFSARGLQEAARLLLFRSINPELAGIAQRS